MQLNIDCKICHVEHNFDQIREEVGNVQEDVNKKLPRVENNLFDVEEKRLHMQKFPSIWEVKLHSSEFIEEFNNPSEIKVMDFDAKQSWTTYCRQFETSAVAGAWNITEQVTVVILALNNDWLDILLTHSKPQQSDEHLKLRYGEKHL